MTATGAIRGGRLGRAGPSEPATPTFNFWSSMAELVRLVMRSKAPGLKTRLTVALVLVLWVGLAHLGWRSVTEDISDLMRQALATAKVPFAGVGKHRLIIKSVSAKQRPRRPVRAAK